MSRDIFIKNGDLKGAMKEIVEGSVFNSNPMNQTLTQIQEELVDSLIPNKASGEETTSRISRKELNSVLTQSNKRVLEKVKEMVAKKRNIHATLAEQWTGIELGKETRHRINPHQEKVEILDEILSLIEQK